MKNWGKEGLSLTYKELLQKIIKGKSSNRKIGQTHALKIIERDLNKNKINI